MLAGFDDDVDSSSGNFTGNFTVVKLDAEGTVMWEFEVCHKYVPTRYSLKR